MNTLLSKKLKALRTRVSMTPQQLGEALNLTELYKTPPADIICSYERGSRTPIKVVIQRYANYFMLHPKHLEALLPEKQYAKRELSPETRWKLGSGNRGRKQRPDEKRKRSEALKGRAKTAEHRANIAKGKTGKPCSETTKRKISETKRRQFRERVSVSPIAATYYRCIEQDRYGMPTEVERSYYDVKGNLIKVERQEVAR